MWLIVFGLVNAYVLLWSGDILYYYGLVGLLLFVFRNVAPRKLIVASAVIMILQTAVSFSEWYGYRDASGAAAAAQQARSAGKVLTPRQSEAIESLARINEEFKPSREEHRERQSAACARATSARSATSRRRAGTSRPRSSSSTACANVSA